MPGGSLTRSPAVEAALRQEYPSAQGWRVISETPSGGRLRLDAPSPAVVQWETVDETDPDLERAVFTAFARLAITLHDPPEMHRILIVPDRREWIAAVHLLTVRAQCEFNLRILAVFKRSRRTWSVRTHDLWGEKVIGIGGDIDCGDFEWWKHLGDH